MVVLAFSLGHIGVMRPQAIGELFFALLLFLLARTPLSPRALWGIPVVLVVWANCHGLFCCRVGPARAVSAGPVLAADRLALLARWPGARRCPARG